ncbi:MAG TPA: Ig-like domain-containing protein, partial [Longimicrobiales bacterium]
MRKLVWQVGGRHAGSLLCMVAAVVVLGSCTSDRKPEEILVGPRAATTGTVSKIVVTPAVDTIAVGGTVQLSATAYASDGSVVQTTFAWNSPHPAIASVSSTGLVTGVGQGSTAILASAGGLTGYGTVTVASGGSSGGGTSGGGTGGTSTTGTINVNTTRYQVINGWEAAAQAMQGTAAFPRFRDTLIALAASDLGINRLRVPVRAGAENSIDYWTQFKKGQLSSTNWQCM